MTLDQAFQLALQQHQAGQLDAARQLYQQILTVNPRHADSLHLLGVMCTQLENYPQAQDFIQRALAIEPNAAHYHSNLGEAFRRAGQRDIAINCYRKALSLNGAFPDAYTNLGIALLAEDRPNEALAAFERLVQLAPNSANAHANLGDALARLGRTAEAVTQYQHAVGLDPRCTSALNNIGTLHVQAGRLDEAQAAYQQAINADPRDPITLQNFGSLLTRRRNFPAARQLYEHFVRQLPQNVDALSGLASVLRETCHLDEALAAYRNAIALNPADPFLHANLATTLRDAGFHAEAQAAFVRALELGPAEPTIHSAYILNQYLLPGVTQGQIDVEKARWDRRHAQALAPVAATFPQSADPHRPLRIGYVSADLRIHPVGRFMLPLIRAHDPAAVSVFCYANSPACDDYTAAIRAAAEGAGHGGFRHVDGLSDVQLADLVHADAIDVLVDLSMHAVGNRLLTFARRPAPVQVSYLAYADGPGLSAIDAHLSDNHLDRHGPRDAAPHDRPVRLPHTYWCYAPHANAPEVSPLPALARGRITFGCLNHFGKITGPTIAAWAALLQRVPTARLLLHVPPGSSRNLVHQRFAAVGIPPERIDFLPTTSLDEYLAFHHQIDIALDPFPYVGGTTTCDALWMGVPVVSLAGTAEAPGTSRSGLSILSTVGLPHLAADSIDAYLQTAAALAADLPALGQLRATLRSRLQNSPLTDIAAFARDIESAYRGLWQAWCSRRGGTT
jgi:predicted O-linked N-acetylglucosamine transferase (SPINDLY family)